MKGQGEKKIMELIAFLFKLFVEVFFKRTRMKKRKTVENSKIFNWAFYQIKTDHKKFNFKLAKVIKLVGFWHLKKNIALFCLDFGL